MRRLIFALIFLAVSLRCADGQVLPITGATAGALLQVTPGTAGNSSVLEVVVVDAGVTVARSATDRRIHVSAPTVVSTPKNVNWITLVQSTADPLTWCTSIQPSTSAPTYTAALLHEVHTQVATPPSTSTGTWTFDVFTDVQLSPQANPTPAQGGVPQWFQNACGNGTAGAVFPSNSLQSGETRVSVQARVVF